MTPELMRWSISIGAMLLIAALLSWGAWAWRGWQRRRRRLIELVESIAPEYQRDVLLPDGADGWFHVDFLLKTASGLMILDVRDVRGAVFAGEHMLDWTVMDGTMRRTFTNPLETLYDRIAAVRAIVGDDVPVDGRILLLARARFATAPPPRTLLLEQLSELAPPADSDGEDYSAAWLALTARTSPTPRSLRRRT